jgi:hypothetical protein
MKSLGPIQLKYNHQETAILIILLANSTRKDRST